MSKKELRHWGINFVKPFWGFIIFLFLFSLIENYILTYEPLFTGKIIDALTQKDSVKFFKFIKFFIVFQVGGFIFSLFGSWFRFVFEKEIGIYAQSRLYLNSLYLPIKTYAEQNRGKLLNLFISDLSLSLSVYSKYIPSLFNSVIIMFVIGFRLFKIHLSLFILTLIVSIVPVFLSRYFGKKQSEITRKQRDKYDEYTEYINETINGLHDIKNYSSQNFFKKKFKNILLEMYLYYKKSTIVGMKFTFSSFLSNFTINISLFIIVGFSVLKGKNTVGTITAALLYSQKFRSLVLSASNDYKKIIVSRIATERLKESFDKRKSKKTFVQYEMNMQHKKEIIIKSLNFSYKDKIIFKNFDAKFSFPGLYLIKGENGAGKTTLFNIILGNLDNNEKNKINGFIKIINLNKKFSCVTQTPFIFSASVKENICFSDNLSEKKLNKVLMETKLDKVIEKLPYGIHTQLGLKNHVLSQGQMQRLALSRCIFQNSEVILFDEVESAFDDETNIALYELLKDLKTKKLILMISHKNDYDNIADEIITL